MAKSRDLDELSAEELFALAAKKMAMEGKTLSDLEIGFEKANKKLMVSGLSERLNLPEGDGRQPCPNCGRKIRVRETAKGRTLRTLGGEVTYRRNYHYCDRCRGGFYPRDIEFGIPKDGEVSQELERRILDFAVNEPFAHGVERFEMHYEHVISTNLLRRVFDRVSGRAEECSAEWIEESAMAPLKRVDTPVVVQTDGSMISTVEGWKEVKVGITYVHDPSRPGRRNNRDARYTAVLGNQQSFEDAVEQALTSHVERPQQVLWLGDGAPGIWSVAKRVAPNAIPILDWYHVMEHASECGKELFANHADLLNAWSDAIARMLHDEGGVEAVISELEQCLFLADADADREALRNLHRYYQRNRSRMKYCYYRRQGWPIGSGAVESAHRHVIQARMKRAGQHWSHKVATKMARMRALYATTGPKKLHAAIHAAHEKTRLAA